jgi:hypothetical protein
MQKKGFVCTVKGVAQCKKESVGHKVKEGNLPVHIAEGRVQWRKRTFMNCKSQGAT